MSARDVDGRPPSVITRWAERVAGRRFGLEPATTSYRVTRGLRVPMRDGVVLLADHYAPVTDAPAGTLLMRGPYTRDALPTRVFLAVYAARGYHVVLQSIRGSFGSGGVFDPGLSEVEDGADTVAWLRRQPWFTGSFATVGGSYLGFCQLALMADPQPEFATAVVTMAPHAIGGAAWGTGTFALSDFLVWSHQMAWHERGGLLRQFIRSRKTSSRLHHVFGQLPISSAADEILGGGSPFYEHWLRNPDASGDYWSRRAVDFSENRQPVLLIGGWQDLFFDQTLEQYRVLRQRGVDVALVIGPWNHGEGGGAAIKESLDWVDGRRRPLPVRIFVTGDGGGWRDMAEWPPPTSALTLHVHPGGSLAEGQPTEPASARFVYDPADPTPTIGGRLLMVAEAGRLDDSALAQRQDVLAFTGSVLAADVEVIGVPHVEIVHRTDAPSADVAVRVSDVDPDGKSCNVSDGFVHTSKTSSPLRIELDAIAHRFVAGHRIRLTIAGGSFPRYARNLGTGEPLATGTDFVRTTHVVDCARSTLVLPSFTPGA